MRCVTETRSGDKAIVAFGTKPIEAAPPFAAKTQRVKTTVLSPHARIMSTYHERLVCVYVDTHRVCGKTILVCL